MDNEGRARAIEVIGRLRPAGGTNIYAGIIHGLETLDAIVEGSFSSLLLLTDGVPNHIPPRGHLSSLQRYYTSHPSAKNVAINTFGFGYSLDSELLVDLAASTGGINLFIPDATFVGTTFINCLCTLLTECARSVTLDLSYGVIVNEESGVNRLWRGPTVGEATESRRRVPIGSVYIGQPRDIVIRIGPGTSTAMMAASTMDVSFRTIMGETKKATRSGLCSSLWATKAFVTIDACERIHNALQWACQGKLDTARQSLSSTVSLVLQTREQMDRDEDGPSIDHAAVCAQLDDFHSDVAGQISLAFSREDWFRRWGVHYLRSIVQAHLRQVCTNFKDPGLQRYGGDLFRGLRDVSEDIFLTIRPPSPSRPVSNARPVMMDMGAYHSSDGVCFTGDSLVTLQNGEQVRAAHVRSGNILRSGGPRKGPALVKCVIRTDFPHGLAELVRLPGGLCITPWHPVWAGGRWVFPGKLSKPEMLPCQSVYSFVLDGSPSCLVAGYPVVALGHGIIGDPVASHAYFGCPSPDHGVLRDLAGLPGWSEGLIVLEGGRCTLRAKYSGEKEDHLTTTGISDLQSTSPVRHGFGSHDKGDVIGIYVS